MLCKNIGIFNIYSCCGFGQLIYCQPFEEGEKASSALVNELLHNADSPLFQIRLSADYHSVHAPRRLLVHA